MTDLSTGGSFDSSLRPADSILDRDWQDQSAFGRSRIERSPTQQQGIDQMSFGQMGIEPMRFDQGLGYSGQDRFVFFYFEPRRKGVCWHDTHASGTGSPGWPQQFTWLAEQARGRGISLGDFHNRGDHVLLVDRLCQQACFAYREEAQEFLARRKTA